MIGFLKVYYIFLIYSIFGKYLISVPDIVSDILVLGFIALSLHNDRYELRIPRKLGDYCIWVIAIPALIILVFSLIVQIFQPLSIDYIIRSATLCIRWVLYCLLGLRTVYVFKEKSADMLLVSCLIAYIPSIIAYFFQNGFVDGVITLFSGEAHNGSTALEVHRVTYVFGFLSVYYLYRWIIDKQKVFPRMLLAVAMLMLGVKRVANFALIIGVVLIITIKFLKKEKTRYRFSCLVATSFVAVALLFVFLVKSGQLQDIFGRAGIEDNFRFNFWNHISPEYEFSPTFIGNGLSYAQRFMWHEWSNIKDLGAVTNLHNDVLCYYIGLGFVGFCLFFGMFFLGQVVLMKKWFSTNSAAFALTMSGFYFIVMTTANEGMPGFVYGCYMMLILAIASNDFAHKDEQRSINERTTT